MLIRMRQQIYWRSISDLSESKNAPPRFRALIDLRNFPRRQLIAVVNLPPRRIGSVVSEVLVLGAVGKGIDTIVLAPATQVPD
jgi:tRNA-binding EMAP/Myf-like protein